MFNQKKVKALSEELCELKEELRRIGESSRAGWAEARELRRQMSKLNPPKPKQYMVMHKDGAPVAKVKADRVHVNEKEYVFITKSEDRDITVGCFSKEHSFRLIEDIEM